mmetsp:Transcript_22658/g.66591  ORF Transcript_22658/g.66591 Transcript_22658/m.66591 type:complete len:518 (-) Transcript_22658:20-1573(-)
MEEVRLEDDEPILPIRHRHVTEAALLQEAATRRLVVTAVVALRARPTRGRLLRVDDEPTLRAVGRGERLVGGEPDVQVDGGLVRVDVDASLHLVIVLVHPRRGEAVRAEHARHRPPKLGHGRLDQLEVRQLAAREGAALGTRVGAEVACLRVPPHGGPHRKLERGFERGGRQQPVHDRHRRGRGAVGRLSLCERARCRAEDGLAWRELSVVHVRQPVVPVLDLAELGRREDDRANRVRLGLPPREPLVERLARARSRRRRLLARQRVEQPLVAVKRGAQHSLRQPALPQAAIADGPKQVLELFCVVPQPVPPRREASRGRRALGSRGRLVPNQAGSPSLPKIRQPDRLASANGHRPNAAAAGAVAASSAVVRRHPVHHRCVRGSRPENALELARGLPSQDGQLLRLNPAVCRRGVWRVNGGRRRFARKRSLPPRAPPDGGGGKAPKRSASEAFKAGVARHEGLEQRGRRGFLHLVLSLVRETASLGEAPQPARSRPACVERGTWRAVKEEGGEQRLP